MPLLLSGADVDDVEADPNAAYFLVDSQDSFQGEGLRIYMKYRDASGVLRLDQPHNQWEWYRVQLVFYIAYDPGPRTLTMKIADAQGTTLREASYTVGTQPGDLFQFHKIGLATDGVAGFPKPQLRGWVDDISTEAAFNRVVRTDDGTAEDTLTLDDASDRAVKNLTLAQDSLDEAVGAVLWSYAQSGECEETFGATHVLLVNGNPVEEFNPCDAWPEGGFSWHPFSIPLSYLQPGGANLFEVETIDDPEQGSISLPTIIFGTDTGDTPSADELIEDALEKVAKLLQYIYIPHWPTFEQPPIGNEPPKACFTTYPNQGTVNTIFQFDGSCSRDDQTLWFYLAYR
ncbi:MAG: hypothetical protein ACREA0_31035, partial [bacterium]